VEHLGLPARDPNALQEWYRRVLGAKLVYDNGAVPQAFFIELPGGMMLEIFEAAGAIWHCGLIRSKSRGLNLKAGVWTSRKR